MSLPTRLAAAALARTFELVSRARSAKSLHPRGAVHRCELEVHGGGPDRLLAGVPFLRERGRHAGVVRFSRSLGLPELSPDILGMAIRLEDAHGPDRPQDLLLVTSGDGAVIHHIFVPGYGYFGLPYSSVLAYRGEGDAFLVGARLAPGSPTPQGNGSEFADLHAAANTGRLRYDIGVAPVNGRMIPIATLTVGERLPDDLNALHFNPWNTGGGLHPAGPVNAIRDLAYRRSQKGWDHDAPAVDSRARAGLR